MQISNLQTFMTLSSQKSFSKAAHLLYISQPALTQRIQKIETELGFPLLERTHKNNFQLTPAGEQFLQFAEKTVSEYENTVKSCKQLASRNKPVYMIGMEQFDLHYLNPDVFSTAHQSYPAFDFNIEYCMHADLLDHLYSHDYDCVFIAKPSHLARGYHFLPITHDQFGCIFSPELAITSQKLTLQDLVNYPLLFPKDEYADFQTLENQVRTFRTDVEINYYQTIAMLSKSTKQHIYISNYGKHGIFKISKCVPLLTDTRLELGFVYRNELPDDFIHFLKQHQSFSSLSSR